MTGSGEIRKLAAVMFTDIEGYTSMFHDNETATLEKIHVHREKILEVLSKYDGQFIKFYGDGSLSIFSSIVDAVNSAKEIQQVAAQHQLPLRIGIHLGDLVIRDDDVYGDVVNVASRIQSTGVPGSIVVSRKVIDELVNQPGISFTKMGQYHLKNVDGPLELYAITGDFLKTPPVHEDRPKTKSKVVPFLALVLLVAFFSWYLLRPLFANNHSAILNEKIAVPPFENFTTNTEFNAVSQMAAHWITTELIELAEANVVSYPSSAFYTNTSEASMPIKSGFAKQTGAINIIKGAFSYTGADKDSLVFWASIINTRTGDPLPLEFDKSYCAANDPLTCIRLMSNEIKGFWKSKNEKVLSPPSYDAYKEYLLARATWDGMNDSVPEYHLRESIRLDPHFLDAYFLLMDHFYNQRNPEEAEDTLRAMRRKFIDLTQRQQNYMAYLEADLKGRRQEAYQYFIKEYAIDPKDIFVNTSAMVMGMTYLNDPRRVLEYYKEIDSDNLDLKDCFYCLERIMLALQAYMLTGQQEKAKAMAEKVRQYAVKRDDYHRLIEWYMSIEDTTSVNEIIRSVAEKELDRDYRYLAFVAGRQAMLRGNLPLRDYYADMTIRLYGNTPSRSLARAYYLKDDLTTSESIYNTLIAKDSNDVRLNGEMGLIYAKIGDTEKANAILRKLEKIKPEFDYGETSYMQGRIKAALNEQEDAVMLLTKALDEGQLFFNSVSFSGDPDLLVLNDNAKYKSLLSRYH